MSQVTQLPKTPNIPILRMIREKQELSETVKYAALNAALCYVAKHHPEADTPDAQYDLAVELAKAALFQAAKTLMDSPPVMIGQIHP